MNPELRIALLSASLVITLLAAIMVVTGLIMRWKERKPVECSESPEEIARLEAMTDHQLILEALAIILKQHQNGNDFQGMIEIMCERAAREEPEQKE